MLPAHSGLCIACGYDIEVVDSPERGHERGNHQGLQDNP